MSDPIPLPPEVIPPEAMPSETLPAEASPPEALPSEALPLGTQPPEALPSGAQAPETQAVAAETTLCPYCGTVNDNRHKCTACGGLFDALSLRATQIAMGPWQVRDKHMPFRPGFSYETLKKMVAGGRIKPNTVLRGPTTMQFWQVARNTPGVSHLLGICHVCNAPMTPGEQVCPKCSAQIVVPDQRDRLGLQYPAETDAQAALKRLQAEVAMANGPTPGSLAPGSDAPGSLTPASQAPASHASLAAGTTAPGADGSASQVAGGADDGAAAQGPPGSALVRINPAGGDTMPQEDLLAGLFNLPPDGVPADGQDWPASPASWPSPSPARAPGPSQPPGPAVNPQAVNPWAANTPAPHALPPHAPAGTQLAGGGAPAAASQPASSFQPNRPGSGSGDMVKILIAVNVVLVLIAVLLIWLINRGGV